MADSTDIEAMKAAFEAKYERDWNDPAGNDMKAIWADAWNAAQSMAKQLLTEALVQISDKPWDDRSLLHARISTYLGREPSYPDVVAEIKAQDA